MQDCGGRVDISAELKRVAFNTWQALNIDLLCQSC
ncbi:MAG: hypothetical protein ACTJH9_08885 [Pseudoalteromonas sp.]